MLRERAEQGKQSWGLDRGVYPVAGFTLRQVVEYYDRISRFMLPHLKDRPVTLKRYPDEASGEFFYEKDAPGFTPRWVKTFAVWRRSGESQIHYILINDRRTLLWAASVGTLEIHAFLAKAPDMERPTMMVFDLDPGPPADILQCAQVALLLRNLLQRLQLRSWVKVSGSKGLQVYVPLNPAVTYGVTQPFSRTIAELLHREHPELIVSEMERAQRTGKVFIDWSQNAHYKTTVAVYSLRAKRRHPYVSLPVSWEELQRALDKRDATSLYFSPEAAVERMQRVGDLFAPVLTLQQRVPESFARELPGTARRQPSPYRAEQILSLPHASAQGGRRRFVLQRHNSQLRLTMEMHRVIRSWEFDRWPRRAGQKVSAREVAPPEKLPNVSQPDRPDDVLDAGTCELIEGNYAKGYLDLYFSGKKVKGEFLLRAEEDRHLWSLEKTALRTPGKAIDGAVERGGNSKNKAPARLQSVDLKALPAAVPAFVPPMECKLVAALPEGERWLYELKLDGYRVIAVKRGAEAQLLSRYGNSMTQRFAAIANGVREAGMGDVVLDGEIVALDEEGRPSFQELQNSSSTSRPIVYYVFDVLNYAGRDLHALPLTTRKSVLQEIAKNFVEPVRPAAALDVDLTTLLAEVRRRKLEGVVAKRKDSFYEAGKRSGAWMKYRINKREVFVIGGYLPGRHYLDAILVGQFRDGKLYFVKKVRNGFVARSREEVFRVLEPLRIPECPFVNLPEPADRRGAVDVEEMKKCVWVRPEVKCEIEFEEWTRGGRLRHAAFRRLV